MSSTLEAALEQHRQAMAAVAAQAGAIAEAGARLQAVLAAGGTVYVCGNGGSAADAQHFAAELTGRYERDRPGYPAVALTTDSSALTAIANDYGFERIFARQLESLGRSGDLLVVISTSGNSPNLLEACRQARRQGIATIGLLGRDGGALAEAVDNAIVIAAERTSRIQEAHIFVLHQLCEPFEPDQD